MSEVSLSFQGKPLTTMISELLRENKKFGKFVPSLPTFLRTLSVYLFVYWLFWVFIAAHRLSLVAETEGYSSLWRTGFSLWWLLLLRSTGSRAPGFSSWGARPSCSMARGILLDQGSNPFPRHWQADSYPLYHHRSLHLSTFLIIAGGINKCDLTNIV